MTTQPRLLDLFCGAGGAAKGYSQAGFTEIVGVDINPQPNYPFEFHQADALEWLTDRRLRDFDLIHASPPCQRFSTATRDASKHPDLIAPVRNGLYSRSHVIENVAGAPLTGWVVELCGSMFGLDIQRHRRFELSGFPMVLVPGGCNHKEWDEGRPWTVTGNISRNQLVDGKLPDRLWKVLNAAAAFGHPGGSVALWSDIVAAVVPEEADDE